MQSEKGKIGRHTLRRDCLIGVRLTEAEYKEFSKLACESGLSLSSYAREIILNYIKVK
jgi:hypothetical protein